MEEVQLVCWV